MLKSIIVLGFLPLWCLCLDAHSKNCIKLLHNLHANNSIFDLCVLNNNEEGTFCGNCLKNYSSVLIAYNDLINGFEHTAEGNRSCRSRFFESNPLNLVDTIITTSKHLWELGYCSDCFDPNCDLIEFSLANCTLSTQTATFQGKFNNTTNCIKSSKEPCTECLDSYYDSNSFYDRIRIKTSDKFCYDIKNKMNKLRIEWTEKGCARRADTPKVEFLTISIFSIFVSVFFYMATYIYGRKQNRIQYIPDNLMAADTSTESNRTIMNVNGEEPSTSRND